MYDWLADALANSSHVATASRRLARELQQEFARQQLVAGLAAWRTPPIYAWSDWLAALIGTATDPADLPTQLTVYQSRVLWERCLRREISDPLLNFTLLARQAGDAWTRLHEWSVPLAECKQNAYGIDKQLFVRAAKNYQSILDQERWVDTAGMAGLALRLLDAQRVALPARITVAGFDRIAPEVQAVLETLRKNGTETATMPTASGRGNGKLHCYENSAAELRAAGAWARGELQRSSMQRIGVVVANLEQDAATYARYLKEGLLPGWQNASSRHAGVVNVSYGKTLAKYPAVASALLALRWIHRDLTAGEVGLLLRTTSLGSDDLAARNRLELQLRQLPDRPWSPQTFLDGFGQSDIEGDAHDWLQRLKTLAAYRSSAPGRDAPARWAKRFDAVLQSINWPGWEPLSSTEFQLVNRWRELLNDFAHLQLVTPVMTLGEAQGRLAALAKETLFQPETEGTVVDLLGPLEAAGMEFDRLWIAGLSATNWPPTGKPLALVSRDLQRSYAMPDANPEDTLEYANRVVTRLVNSAAAVVVSYPLTEGDAEQTVTGLLAGLDLRAETGPPDPHWHASRLIDQVAISLIADDRVPAVRPDEYIAGGAATLQRQLDEPLAAFIYGRLGVRRLPAITAGLSPNIRGNLIHGALQHFYADKPSSLDIAAWSNAELQRRSNAALQAAFRSHERLADPVLKRLLALEKVRARALLRDVVEVDRSRGDFTIDSVEKSVDTDIDGIRLRLRYDRIDRLDDGEVVILDYKTGNPQRLLDRSGELRGIQLVVYACAVSDPVGGIGLINIDSRATGLDAAGRTFTPELDWDAVLLRWQDRVHSAAIELACGDVRISASQNLQSARPLALLSRFVELRRDA